MLSVINKTHPREKIMNEETKEVQYRHHPICKTNLGFHDCCSRERRRSDFDEYGVGTVLYFQFLKYMGCLFLAMAFLSIPSMLFFFYGTELTDYSLTKIVTAASLGNLGSSSPVCKFGTFDETDKVQIELSCAFGELYAIEHFGQISINEDIDCEIPDPTKVAEKEFNFYPDIC